MTRWLKLSSEEMITDSAVSRIFSDGGKVYLEKAKGGLTKIFHGSDEQKKQYNLFLESALQSDMTIIDLEYIARRVQAIDLSEELGNREFEAVMFGSEIWNETDFDEVDSEEDIPY